MRIPGARAYGLVDAALGAGTVVGGVLMLHAGTLALIAYFVLPAVGTFSAGRALPAIPPIRTLLRAEPNTPAR